MKGSQLHIHINHAGISRSNFLNILYSQSDSKTVAGATVERLFVTSVRSHLTELAAVRVQHRPVSSGVTVMTKVAGYRQHCYLRVKVTESRLVRQQCLNVVEGIALKYSTYLDDWLSS